MLFILLCFFIGWYYSQYALALLWQRLPPLKADWLKLAITLTAFLLVISSLLQQLLGSVWLYGLSLSGFTFGGMIFYILLVPLLICIGWMVKVMLDYSQLLKTSVAIVGIGKEYALQVLYKTLERMSLRHQENVSVITLLDTDVKIEITITANEIRFRVDQALDKLLLNRLCKIYQQQYRADALPISKRSALFSALFGLLFLMAAGFMAVNWITVKIFNSCLFFCL